MLTNIHVIYTESIIIMADNPLVLWQSAIKEYKSRHPDKKSKIPKKGTEEYLEVKAIHQELIAKSKPQQEAITLVAEGPPDQQQPITKESSWIEELETVLAKHRSIASQPQQQSQPPVQEQKNVVDTPAKRPRGRPRKVQDTSASAP